jgi:sodium/hydrogen antiporter
VGGVVAGAAAGGLAAYVVKLAGGRSLIAGSWRQLIPAAAAALAYGTAVGLGGSGFIAAFVAGMLFGTLLREDTGEITIFADEAGARLQPARAAAGREDPAKASTTPNNAA